MIELSRPDLSHWHESPGVTSSSSVACCGGVSCDATVNITTAPLLPAPHCSADVYGRLFLR